MTDDDITPITTTYEEAIDPASLATRSGLDGVEVDQTEFVFPNGIDPDHIPDFVEELYVARGRTSHRRYHLDPRCDRLRQEPKTRRPVIGADWYPPCQYCVADEMPLEGIEHNRGETTEKKLREAD